MTDQATPLDAAKAVDDSKVGLSVRVMVIALALLGAVFFVASLWNYTLVQRYFEPPKVELRAELARLQGSDTLVPTQESREWTSRVALEELALMRRYQLTSAAVQSRVWTRLMGFLTGMVLVFSGCIFILGKLREDVNVSGDIDGAKWALITSSPGIVFALAGTTLIGLAIYVPTSVEASDSSIYLPVVAAVPNAGSGGARRQALPAPMPPRGGVSDVSRPAAEPGDVMKLLKDEAAKGNAAAAGGSK